MANPIIKQIKIGTITYDIRDSTLIDGVLRFIGVSTTAITDGGTQAPTINGDVIPVTDLRKGDVVLYGSNGNYQEFLWTDDGSAGSWELLGDEGSYVIKGTYITDSTQAGGTISQPTFTGTSKNIGMSGTIPATNIPVGTSSDASITAIDFSGTPSATISAPSFTGQTHGHTISAAAPGSGQTANYTPGGSVSASGTGASGHSFSPTAGTVTVTTSGTALTAVSAELSDTPSFTGTTASVSHEETFETVLTSASGTTASITVSNEVLNLPTVLVTAVSSATTTVVKSVSISDFQPSGTVSKPTITVTPAKGTVTSTGTFTPAGSIVGAHSWSGTGVFISASDTQAGGTVSQPAITFETLTISKRLVAALPSIPFSASGSYTPEGTVSAPTFTGTAHTHNITFS